MAYRINGQIPESGDVPVALGESASDDIEELRKENARLETKVQELTAANEKLIRENDRLRLENHELIEDNLHASKQPSFNAANSQLSGYTQLTSHVLGGTPEKKGSGRKQNTRRKKRK